MPSVQNLYFYQTEDLDLGYRPQEIISVETMSKPEIEMSL